MLLLNAFYLQEEASRGRIDVVDETLASAARLGAKLVRAWAFNDAPDKRDDSAIQIGRLIYREEGLRGVDVVLERARAHGLRLILALGDYWSSYGGVEQWCRWNGIGDAVEGDARFFTDERVRDHYRQHCARLLDRKNSITKIRWGDDPAVFAWELLNEPRGEIVEWVRFAAGCVREHARQLVAVGSEEVLVLPELDLASVHLFPEKSGVDPERFLVERARIAGSKPIYLGEFGLRPRPDRGEIYRRWLQICREAGYFAAGPWGFSYDSRPAEWDEFSFYAGMYDEILQEFA